MLEVRGRSVLLKAIACVDSYCVDFVEKLVGGEDVERKDVLEFGLLRRQRNRPSLASKAETGFLRRGGHHGWPERGCGL